MNGWNAPGTGLPDSSQFREVVRRHYIRLEQEGTKVGAMARLEQAYEKCAASVQ